MKSSETDIQNALRTLCAVLPKQVDFYYVGGDLYCFKGQIMRTQELAQLLAKQSSERKEP